MLAKSKLRKHGPVKGNENLKITVQQIRLSLLTLETKLKVVTCQVKEHRGFIEKHGTFISELLPRLKLGRMNGTHSYGTKSGEESFNHESSDNDSTHLLGQRSQITMQKNGSMRGSTLSEEPNIGSVSLSFPTLHPNNLARVTMWVMNRPKNSQLHGRTTSQPTMTRFSWATKTFI
ncbi:unnamed protein product [Allacma fusca]|uniref:Uncharacterized protein n=1 Tax=Allacma fusca TaxID=39272 RepID=A0A8J2NNM3_9HEXA|nr:unnamed protein product [Allacma fusca]